MSKYTRKTLKAMSDTAVNNARQRNARKLDLEVLDCRGPLRHHWERVPNDGSRVAAFGKLITHECKRCGTMRWDSIQRSNGALLQRNYGYPQGFALEALPNGERPVSADSLRYELVRRLELEEDAAEIAAES